MSRDLISVVTEALGVEIEEEFRLKGVEGYKFFIDSRGYIQCFSIETGRFDGEYTADYDLQYLLKNPNDIIKAPFEPKTGDEYWTYSETWEVEDWVWTYDFLDLVYKRVGIVFRTKKEAIEARPAKYKELTGKEWESR